MKLKAIIFIMIAFQANASESYSNIVNRLANRVQSADTVFTKHPDIEVTLEHRFEETGICKFKHYTARTAVAFNKIIGISFQEIGNIDLNKVRSFERDTLKVKFDDNTIKIKSRIEPDEGGQITRYDYSDSILSIERELFSDDTVSFFNDLRLLHEKYCKKVVTLDPDFLMDHGIKNVDQNTISGDGGPARSRGIDGGAAPLLNLSLGF